MEGIRGAGSFKKEVREERVGGIWGVGGILYETNTRGALHSKKE